MSSLMDWISATAVSFTVSGNTGIAPFMSLFIVGLIEKTNPELLYMDGFIEQILSSWAALVILGILCVLEFVGKCVPVIDEIIDSALTVVVPIFSILGSLSTFGLFTMPSTQITMGDEDGEYVGDVYDYEGGNADGNENGDGDARRQLTSSAASGVLIFFQVIVVFIGILLALCLHGLKMIVRLMGEGCLTNCITVLEYMWIGISITLAIFIREIAICVAILFCLVAAYITKRRFVDKKTIEDIAKTDGDAVRSAVAAQASAVVVNPQSTQQGTSQSLPTTSQQDFVKMANDEEQQQPVSYQSSF